MHTFFQSEASAVQRGKKMDKLFNSLKALEQDPKFIVQEWQFYGWLTQQYVIDKQEPNFATLDEVNSPLLDFEYKAIEDEYKIENDNKKCTITLYNPLNKSNDSKNIIQLNSDYSEQLGEIYFGGEINFLNIPGIILQSLSSKLSIILFRDIRYPIVTKLFCLEDGNISNTTQLVWLNFAKFKIHLFNWQEQKISNVYGINELIRVCLHQYIYKILKCIYSNNNSLAITIKENLDLIRRTRKTIKNKQYKYLDSLEQQRTRIEFQMKTNQNVLFPNQINWSQFDQLIVKLIEPKYFRQFKKFLLLEGVIQQYSQWMWMLAIPSLNQDQIKLQYQEGIQLMEGGSPYAKCQVITSEGVKLEDDFIKSCYSTAFNLDDLHIKKVIKLMPFSKKQEWSKRYVEAIYENNINIPNYSYMSTSGRIPLEMWYFEESSQTDSQNDPKIGSQNNFICKGLPIVQMIFNAYSYRYMWMYCVQNCSFKNCSYCQNCFKFCRIYVLARLVALKTKNGYGLGICTECGLPFTEMKGLILQNLPTDKEAAFRKYTSKFSEEIADILSLHELEIIVELIYEGDNYLSVKTWEDLNSENIDLDLILMYAWAIENNKNFIPFDGFRNLLKSVIIADKLKNLKKVISPPSIFATFTHYEGLLSKISMKQEDLNNRICQNNFIVINPDKRIIKLEELNNIHEDQRILEQFKQSDKSKKSQKKKENAQKKDISTTPFNQKKTNLEKLKVSNGAQIKKNKIIENENENENENELSGVEAFIEGPDEFEEDQEILLSEKGQKRLNELKNEVPLYFKKQMQLKQLLNLLKQNINDKIVKIVIHQLQKYEWIVLLDVIDYKLSELQKVNDYREKILNEVKLDNEFLQKHSKLYTNSLNSKKIRKLANVYENYKVKNKIKIQPKFKCKKKEEDLILKKVKI